MGPNNVIHCLGLRYVFVLFLYLLTINILFIRPTMANEDWRMLTTTTTTTTTTTNNGQQKPTQAHDSQQGPMQAYNSQQRPMQANKSQCRPMTVKKDQWKHNSQQRQTRAYSSQRKPMKSHTGIRYVSIFFIYSFTTDISDILLFIGPMQANKSGQWKSTKANKCQHRSMKSQCRPTNSQHRPMTSCMMIEMGSITCTYLIAIK